MLLKKIIEYFSPKPEPVVEKVEKIEPVIAKTVKKETAVATKTKKGRPRKNISKK
jgi:hypothetical protein